MFILQDVNDPATRLPDYRRPASTLQHKQHRQIFQKHVLQPLLSIPGQTIAMRIKWPGIDQAEVWAKLDSLRNTIDQAFSTFQPINCWFSALSATVSKVKSAVSFDVIPAVSFWIKLRHDTNWEERLFHEFVNNIGVNGTMSVVLHTHQTEHKTICNALYAVVKDNMKGVVRRTVDSLHGEQAVPITKAYAATDRTVAILQTACEVLNSSAFQIVFVPLTRVSKS